MFFELYFLEAGGVFSWTGCVVRHPWNGEEGSGSGHDGQQEYNSATFLVRGHGGVVVNDEEELGGVLDDCE